MDGESDYLREVEDILRRSSVHLGDGNLQEVSSRRSSLGVTDCGSVCLYENPVQLRPVTDAPPSNQLIDEERRGLAYVELQKKEGYGLGLTVSGGTDKGTRPHISNLRPGGIAHRSDSLTVGDYILSVNGIRTANLKHDEIVNLLKNAGERIILEVEYELPELGGTSFNVQCKTADVVLERDGMGFGFTLRGGMKIDQMRAHPLTITSIRPGGSADREGSLKEGDRIIFINNYKVTHLSLSETMAFLQQCEQVATFTVEYDVSVMESVQNANGPLLVEIDTTPGSHLGITLSQSAHQGRRCVCVDTITPMSVADRSGALHVGDHILAIDGASVEHMSVAEATQLMKCGPEDVIKLEILPVTHLEYKASRDALTKTTLANIPAASSPNLPQLPPSISSFNGFGTLPSRSYNTLGSSASAPFGTLPSRGSGRSKKNWTRSDRKISSCMSIASNTTSVLTANNQVCHPEATEVMLFCDKKGLGIQLEGGVFSTATLSEPPVIAYIDPNSPAEQCGVIQEGDRILTVNGVDLSDKTLEEVNQLLRDSRPRCMMEIEFDVAESVTPSSGTYVVRIPKKPGGLGMTIIDCPTRSWVQDKALSDGCPPVTAPSQRKPGDQLIITGVRKGSVAYRCGSVQPGDKLLAVNDIRMENCTVEDAITLLESSDDIIKLKLKREDPYAEDNTEGCVTYTVELQRHGGPLGVTITGTEDPLDPIIISDLVEGGLAEKTGAIHIGDRLLAINGKLTRAKPLSVAINMLQMAGDVVTLKIARPMLMGSKHRLLQLYEGEDMKPATPIPSVDSALESWDSSGQDIGHSHLNGNSQPLVVAVPQPRNKKMMDLMRPMSTDSAGVLEGSGEGMADMHMSDEEWDNDSGSDCSSFEPDEWAKTLADFEKGSGSEMLRQIGLSLRERSCASLDRRSRASDDDARKQRSQSACRMNRSAMSQDCISRYNNSQVKSRSKESLPASRTFQEHMQTIFTPMPIQLHRVTVEKDTAVEDFGFSLSDGMYEKGVFISAVRQGSAAQRAGLKMYDRILQVNRVKTRDFDCCLTVPLIAEAGNKLHMVVCRNPLLRQKLNQKELYVTETPTAANTTQSSGLSCKTV
ncbi:glutamate receptor-interacting protein 1-like isoform X1 [Haliotis asinina]|uniref:glutamate receptor-interacting protein 1-like isoform X1 n=1 Tax=Haliotis asinina TaxID=109174 RepID=UPI0035322DA1